MGVMRVLVVEDHVTLAARIGEGLRDAGMAVDVVHDGAAALTGARQTAYDVVVLDRDLPVVHGDQVCRSLCGGARILMLTAAATVDDRVDGLELGADDYLASRSPSRNWSPGYGRWPGARRRRRPSSAAAASPSTSHDTGRPATAGRCR
jgi:CheY-like chemotaxis protein